jgi:hypothetical protein
MPKPRPAPALTLLLCCAVAQAQVILKPPPPPDTCQQGLTAFSMKHYRSAVRSLETFLTSSAGDPRADKAAKTLHDARIALVKECMQSGRAGEAAEVSLALAQDAEKFKESSDTYTKGAVQLLTNAIADAQKKRAPDKILELHAVWTRLFSDKPSPVTDDQLAAARIDLLLACSNDKFNQLTLPDVIQRVYPDGSAPLDEITKKNRGTPLNALYFKALADVGWAGRYIAEYQRLEADSPVRADKNFADQTERMFLRRAEAFFQQGNVPETRKAIAEARPETHSSAGQSALKTMESRLPPDVGDALGGKPAAPTLRDISFPQPLKGKSTWADKGEGIGEAKDVILDDGAEVTVAAGTVLNGGKITLKAAKLRLAGEPARPVTFRNVTIQIEPGGEFEAQDAILENCTFSKVTPKANGVLMLYASKWSFNECILYRSTFRSLSRASYGLHLANSAIIECDLPHRYTSQEDLASAYSGSWEVVQNCLFLRCHTAVSILWVSKNCNFVACSIALHDYVSFTGITVPLYMPDADPLISSLPGQMVEPSTGLVGYAFSRRPYDVKLPPSLWALLPIDLATTPGNRSAPASE